MPPSEDLTFEFQTWLSSLGTYLDDLQRSARRQSSSHEVLPDMPNMLQHSGKNRGYSLAFLLRVVLLVADLRSVRNLKDVIKNALSVVLPRHARHLQEALDQQQTLPSRATIIHVRLVLDVALMLLQRMENRAFSRHKWAPEWALPSQSGHSFLDVRGAVYWLVDSSPQGGRNWLMMEYWKLQAEHVLPTFFLAHELLHLHADRRKQDVQEDSEQMLQLLDRESEIFDSIASALSHHHVPPVGLGSGQASAHHEAAALAHAHFLESGSTEVMIGMAESVVSFTTEKGTERLLESMPPTPMKMLLGHFCPEFAEDLGCNEVAPEAEPTSNGLDPFVNFNFPFALCLSGGLHVLSNCTKAALLAMPHYELRIFPLLDKLATALHARFFRERLFATCFRDGPGRAFQHLFRTFPCTLVKWRWGSFVQVCEELLLREQALRTCWRKDAIAFKTRFEEDPAAEEAHQPPHSEHLSGPSLKKTSEAVHSPFFWAWVAHGRVTDKDLGTHGALDGVLQLPLRGRPTRCAASKTRLPTQEEDRLR